MRGEKHHRHNFKPYQSDLVASRRRRRGNFLALQQEIGASQWNKLQPTALWA
jgi:hypothetical protein